MAKDACLHGPDGRSRRAHLASYDLIALGQRTMMVAAPTVVPERSLQRDIRICLRHCRLGQGIPVDHLLLQHLRQMV